MANPENLVRLTPEKAREIGRKGGSVKSPAKKIAARLRMLKKKGLNPKNFRSYLDSFRFGAPPHAGWSIGLERFTQALLGLNNIREACLFPRDRDRLSP